MAPGMFAAPWKWACSRAGEPKRLAGTGVSRSGRGVPGKNGVMSHTPSASSPKAINSGTAVAAGRST